MIATALLVVAYLIGSIPFGVIVASRFAGLDVRKLGSGNIGATNVARVAGKKLGAVVLLLDALKGFAPTLAARLLVPDEPWLHVAVGAAALLGHLYPIYLRLKGGKGVATALGVFLVLIPVPVAAGLAVFAALFAARRIVSAASMAAACTVSAVAFAHHGLGPYSYLALFAAVMILWRHRSNIRRIVRREEKRLS